MLLALGPLQLDTAAGTVVVGLADSLAPGCVERAAVGADLVWLQRAGTGAEVAEAAERAELPVGATVEEAAALDDLLAAGLAAVELRSGAADAVDAVPGSGSALWCTPGSARRALDAGIAPDRIIVEGHDGSGPGLRGTTIAGDGPAAWGSVVRAVLDGTAVVRTTDVQAVRRVVTVVDRLVAARDGGRA